MSWTMVVRRTELAAIHLLVGGLLLFLNPLFHAFMAYERASLYSFHALIPLVPCIGLGWMILGALIMTGKRQVYRVARVGHIIWLCVVGCSGVLGVVLIGLGLWSGNRQPSSGAGSLAQFGLYLFGLSTIMFGITIGILVVLRYLLREQSEVTSDKQKKQACLVIFTAVFSVLLAVFSLGWQYSIDNIRQREIAQEHQLLLQNYAYDSGAVNSLVFSPNSKYLATATEIDYSHCGVRVWEVDSGKIHKEIDGGLNVLSLAFTPDESRLIVCYEEQWNTGGFTIFDLENGLELLRNSEFRVSSVSISADGTFLVACGNVGYGNPSLIAPFSIWNLNTYEKLYESAPSYGYVSAAFSESGSLLAVRRQKAIEIWPFPLSAGLAPVRTWDPRSGATDVKSISFCSDDAKLAVIGIFGSKTWHLGQAGDGPDDASTLPIDVPTNAGAFTDDRSWLVVANQQQVVQIIDLGDETLAREFHAPFWVEGVAISSVKQLIAIGGHQRVIIIDANTGNLVRELAQSERTADR